MVIAHVIYTVDIDTNWKAKSSNDAETLCYA